jgi:hypothetical protein
MLPMPAMSAHFDVRGVGAEQRDDALALGIVNLGLRVRALDMALT